MDGLNTRMEETEKRKINLKIEQQKLSNLNNKKRHYKLYIYIIFFLIPHRASEISHLCHWNPKEKVKEDRASKKL